MKLNKKQIDELLTRGVEKVIIKKNVEKRLKKGDKLTLKLGIDPTGTDLHIGHMVVIRKLREFQKLGHSIVIIVGDYTARIGDPTGRDKMREPLNKEAIYANSETYQKQIGKILDLDETAFRYQSEWFDDATLTDIMRWAGIFTVQQMIDRDMYQRRLKEGNPIGLHEFLYPLIQAYDSVAIKADIEFGATDQEFNLLIGRTMQQHFNQKPQDILTTSLLLGTDGRKMSKTYNNYIGVMDAPQEIYGKVMSAMDEVIVDYFKLTTDVSLEEIKKMERALISGELNPRDAKAELAHAIVDIYHGKKEAEKAEKEFERIFKNKEQPTDIPEFKATKPEYELAELLVSTKLVQSKNEAKRLVEQGGVKINHKVVNEWNKPIRIKNNLTIQVGKRRFVKVVT